MIELIEVEPGKWRVARVRMEPKRSDLSVPYVISDIMEPTEQVNGVYYTSKREFRAVGRALGLIEVGNEKLKPKTMTDDKPGRVKSIKKAVEQYRGGRRV